MFSEIWAATWKEGHATISLFSDKYTYCLWSVSFSGKDDSEELQGKRAKGLESAKADIEKRIGFAPDFQLISRFSAEDLENEQTWVAKWRRGRIEVTGCDGSGYLWDVFERKDENILDYGTANTKEEAFNECAKVVKHKLKFEAQG